MKLLKSNNLCLLMSCSITLFISGIAYLSPVQAVTDAELEALEKQIQQQEADEINHAKEETKRKVDKKAKAEAKAKAKRKAKAEKKRIAQAKAEEEQKKIAEKKCTPLLLPPTPHKFSKTPHDIYNNPILNNSPAPKIKWIKYKTSGTYYSGDVAKNYKSVNHTYFDESDSVYRKGRYKEDWHMTDAGEDKFDSLADGDSTTFLGGFLGIYHKRTSDMKSTSFDDSVDVSFYRTTYSDFSGKLFPLEVNNKLEYVSRTDAGETKFTSHGKFTIISKLAGKEYDSRLTCDIYFINHKRKNEFDNDIKNESDDMMYFIPELGIILPEPYGEENTTFEIIDFELL